MFSDDNGKAWDESGNLGEDNETQIAQADSLGNLIMVTRTRSPMGKSHGKLHKLTSFSDDGGTTWSKAQKNKDLKIPICMSSIIGNNNILYYSYPNQYFSRANLTLAKSIDGGKSWNDKKVIYPGPAGYSDMSGLSNGDILILFENGAVEYDEQITLVKIENRE